MKLDGTDLSPFSEFVINEKVGYSERSEMISLYYYKVEQPSAFSCKLLCVLSDSTNFRGKVQITCLLGSAWITLRCASSEFQMLHQLPGLKIGSIIRTGAVAQTYSKPCARQQHGNMHRQQQENSCCCQPS